MLIVIMAAAKAIPTSLRMMVQILFLSVSPSRNLAMFVGPAVLENVEEKNA